MCFCYRHILHGFFIALLLQTFQSVKVCNTVTFTGKIFTIIGDSQVHVDWTSNLRPDAIGAINRRVYPRTGHVDFPDDRVYPFWYYPEESIIYWDIDRGSHTWNGAVLSDCVDYNPGYKQIEIQSAEASTFHPDFPPNLIYDDDVSTIYHSKEVNGAASTPWVKVHFATTTVEKVVIVNRLVIGADTCEGDVNVCLQRLENTVISLWKDGNKVKDCGTIPYVYLKSNSERNQTYVEYCGGATGDMVKVSRTGQYLHFAEIRIYSKLYESYSEEVFTGYSYDAASTTDIKKQNTTSILGVGSKIRIPFSYDGSNLGDRWFRLYTATDKGVLHFRILHTSAGNTYMEIRFNQRRWNENVGAEQWVGPWINPMPTLITGTNVVEIMMEVETFQVSFNGVHIDLERSMPVYVNELSEVRYIFMQLKDDHVAFLDGTKILTPHAVPNPGQYIIGALVYS